MDIAKNSGTVHQIVEFQAYSTDMLATPYLQSKTLIIQRNCRFFNESNLEHYPVYTKRLCFSECRLKLVLERCGCIPHFYPNKSE